MKRFILWTAVLLVTAIAIVVATPASRYALLGMLGIERLYNGRPVAYWVQAIHADDPDVRRQAALSLGDAGAGAEPVSGADGVIEALVMALGDSNAYVRKCAATSLLIYPKESTVPTDAGSVRAMLEGLRDEQVAVRQASARALWQAGPVAGQTDGVKRLTAALDDSDTFVRAYACRALARIGPEAESAVPALLRHLRDDEDRDIRKLSAKSLGLIGPRAVGPLLPDVVTALSASLKDDLRGLREYAARSLGQLGSRDAIPALREAVGDRDAGVRAAAKEAIKLLESTKAS